MKQKAVLPHKFLYHIQVDSARGCKTLHQFVISSHILRVLHQGLYYLLLVRLDIGISLPPVVDVLE